MEPTQLPLRDIHLPEAISWWPFALGWWLLLILIPLTLFALMWLYKRLTRKTAVKTAKKLLIQFKQDKAMADADKVEAISALIRRVAMSVNPRSDCASLTGKAWLAYLDNSLEDNAFSEGVGQVLISAKYQKNIADKLNIDEFIVLTERWLKAQKT
ncbi:MAG: DUF4381 family protein [Methylococcaceae bacterium]|nr:DUF4381 family protein [Methylococcaceae bacterium]